MTLMRDEMLSFAVIIYAFAICLFAARAKRSVVRCARHAAAAILFLYANGRYAADMMFSPKR